MTPLVCSADELCIGDRVDAPGLDRTPIVAVTYIAGLPHRQPALMVRVEWFGGPVALLLPTIRVSVFPGEQHVAAHYSRLADAARGLPHTRRTTR